MHRVRYGRRHAARPLRSHRPPRLAALPRHDDVRVPVRRRDVVRHPRRRRRGRHHVPRHRRRLPARRARGAARSHRGDRRPLDVGPAGSRIVVASKCFCRTGPKPWDAGNSRQNIMRAVEASLRRLRTDHIDLYQLHGWDAGHADRRDAAGARRPRPAGKVRYIGCSNFLAYQLARSIGRSEVLGTARFDSVQPRYNLLFRQTERELLPLCDEEGIGVIPYNPIAGGLLTGKHQPGAPTEGTRVHPRPRRPAGTRSATGTTGVRHRRRVRPIAAEAGCRSPSWRWRGCWPTRRSPRRSSVPAVPSSSTDALRAPRRRSTRPEGPARRAHRRVPLRRPRQMTGGRAERPGRDAAGRWHGIGRPSGPSRRHRAASVPRSHAERPRLPRSPRAGRVRRRATGARPG